VRVAVRAGLTGAHDAGAGRCRGTLASPVVISLEPIGVVVGGRTEPIDDDWGGVEAVVRLDRGRFGPDAVAGLDEFSHLCVVFQFHLVDESAVVQGARHPRGNPEWPLVGMFAQRAKMRPNRLGVSNCSLVSVEGLDLHVRGLDAIDGSPVLDIKPFMREFEPTRTVQPAWATELMRGYY
jgi:tRNA-Thr(GGU) m(6)t(6)A37 methyltransferase TsaA